MSQLNRRSFLKQTAAATAMATAASLIPGVLFAGTEEQHVPEDAKWKKTPCRFCGVGCG